MEQRELDLLETEFVIKADSARGLEYEICDGINTDANPGFTDVIRKILENLPENLKANLLRSVKKRIAALGLTDELKVQSNLTIETTINVLKKEIGKKPLEMYENDYYRLFRLKNYGLHIGGHHYCIAKELVDRERKSVRTILRKWGDRTSKCTLGGKEFLVIKDFESKTSELRQGFQKYRRLSMITIGTSVVCKKARVGDMLWRIEISLPEMEITKSLTFGAKKGQWELLTQNMRERPEGHFSFEKAVKRLNERVEREKNKE